MAPKKNPLTAHLTDAGMTERAALRIEKMGRGGERRKRAAIRRALQNPIRVAAPTELPADFVSEGLGRMEPLLRIGHWEQLHKLVDHLKREWEEKQIEAQSQPLGGALLGLHVTWLKLQQRTTNLVESVCSGTVGALLEAFPGAFVGLPNCGPKMVEEIASALVLCGALTHIQARRRVAEWEERTVLSR